MYTDSGINKQEFIESVEELGFKVGEVADVAHGYKLSLKNLDPYLEGEFEAIEAILRSAMDRIYKVVDQV